MTNFNRVESLRAIYENMNRMYDGDGAEKCILTEAEDFDEDNMTDRDYSSVGYGLEGGERRRKMRNRAGGFGDEYEGSDNDENEAEDLEGGDAPPTKPAPRASRRRAQKPERGFGNTVMQANSPVPEHWPTPSGISKRVLMSKSGFEEGDATDQYFNRIGDEYMSLFHRKTVSRQLESVIYKALTKGRDELDGTGSLLDTVGLGSMTTGQVRALSHVLAHYINSPEAAESDGPAAEAHRAVAKYGVNLSHLGRRSEEYGEPPERGTEEFDNMAADPNTQSFIADFNVSSKSFGPMKHAVVAAVYDLLTGDERDRFVDEAIDLNNDMKDRGIEMPETDPLSRDEMEDEPEDEEDIWDSGDIPPSDFASDGPVSEDPAVQGEISDTEKPDASLDADDDKYEGESDGGVYGESNENFTKLFNGLYKAIFD